MSFIKELWKFLRVRKKLWLLPIIVVMVVLGGLLLLVSTGAGALSLDGKKAAE